MEQANPTAKEQDGSHDFDFLFGSWKVQNRRLKAPLTGSNSWYEFSGKAIVRPIWDGRANVDEYEADSPAGRIHGMTVRLYESKAKQWRLYWANSEKGMMEIPTVGAFRNGRGEFFDQEIIDGRAIFVRYTWSNITEDSCRWEQAFSPDGGRTWETNWSMEWFREIESEDYPIIEFRRYTVQETERENFVEYFETYFPEAFQQLNAIIFGQFLERGNPKGFTWVRGFHDVPARAKVNQAFYDGPVWKEHGPRMNARMIDHTNVLLLQPLRPEHGIRLSPPADPIREPEGAKGLVIVQIFPVRQNSIQSFAEYAESTFARYRATGAKQAGILVTLDVPNNFPRPPFRTDGPYLVWLGLVENEETWDRRLKPIIENHADFFAASSFLRGKPELVVLEPTRRSRLRWFQD